MILFKNIADLRGILRLDPNSYQPYKEYFSKPIQEDLYFASKLDVAVIILSHQYDKICQGMPYVAYAEKYGPIGNKIRDSIGPNPPELTERDIREIIRILFENQEFTELEKVIHNKSKFTNKHLIDIRQTGGEYPYHYILEHMYYIDPSTPDFQSIEEGRQSSMVNVKTILEEFDQAIEKFGLDRGEEWNNLFKAILAFPKGDVYA